MLTIEQLPILKAAILAETDPVLVAARDAGATGVIADFYNTASTFYVWRSTTSVDTLMNAITWANLTPADAPDATVTYTNRALLCQSKQINLHIILGGRNIIASNDVTVRNGLSDALQNVPSGVAGALQDAGWFNAKAAMYRLATKGEKLFATGTGTTGAPGSLVVEGQLRNEDVVLALAS